MNTVDCFLDIIPNLAKLLHLLFKSNQSLLEQGSTFLPHLRKRNLTTNVSKMSLSLSMCSGKTWVVFCVCSTFLLRVVFISKIFMYVVLLWAFAPLFSNLWKVFLNLLVFCSACAPLCFSALSLLGHSRNTFSALNKNATVSWNTQAEVKVMHHLSSCKTW